MEYMTALRPIYEVHSVALRANARSPARMPASNATVSSLGVIERYMTSDHGALTVENFRLGSAIMTRQPSLYIWTFRGRLTISLDYNKSYYSIGAVTALLRSIRSCSEKELRLSLE